MKKTYLAIIILMLSTYSSLIYAKNLNGTMVGNGGGEYSLNLADDAGNTYTGDAKLYDSEGTLTVTVKSDNGDTTYSGTASTDGDNQYSLHLSNNDSGEDAVGTVKLNR